MGGLSIPGDLHQSRAMSVCMSVCLSVCLSVHRGPGHGGPVNPGGFVSIPDHVCLFVYMYNEFLTMGGLSISVDLHQFHIHDIYSLYT